MQTTADSPGTTASRDWMMLVAAIVTWAAVALASVDVERLQDGNAREWWGMACVLGFAAVFLACPWLERQPHGKRLEGFAAIAMALLVVLANTFLLEGMLAVLLVIVAAHMAQLWPARRVLLVLAAVNLAFAATWIPVLPALRIVAMLVPVVGFQAFAALTSHYAASAVRGRAQLAHTHAELLATQALLAEGARSGERLKLSRELHDVAGHKLTALKLHLARLRRDPALAEREEVGIASVLADELLDDIRGVVSEMRSGDGIDLRTALLALATPFPAGQVRVEVADDVRVDDLVQAEALVRCAQESITNALRHGHAQRVRVEVVRDGPSVSLQVDNDGTAPRGLRPGNGLAGMRERLEALGGTLELQPGAARGLRVRATLPAAAA